MRIDPVAFSIGSIEIRYYGLVYVLGMLAVYLLLTLNSKRLKLRKGEADSIILSMMAGLIIGARIFHFLFSEPSVFWREPAELIRVWNGGMSFFGGFIGAVSGVLWHERRSINRFFRIADLTVLPVSFALILGRVANFINSELPGTVSDAAWCAYFMGYQHCRHPYPLYAALSHLALFIILLILYRKRRRLGLEEGSVFLSFAAFYGLFRLITDFFREDPRYLGLTVWQLFSVGIASAGIYFFLKRNRRHGMPAKPHHAEKRKG